jgi:colanic acid/amylovoran biosynthesis protein
MTYKVCILGASLDVGNRGVRALGVSLALLLSRLCPGVDIAFHYGNRIGGSRRLSPEVEITIRNCRLSLKSRPAEHMAAILVLAALHRIGIKGPARRNGWLSSILDADFVGDITGGDSFADIYGLRRFVSGSLPLLSVVLLRKPYTMLPQTYGPFRSPVSRVIAKFLLRRAANILTRDTNCASAVRELSGKSATFCPDVAFTLERDEPFELRILPQHPGFNSDTTAIVGINVSGLLYVGGYTGANMFGLRCEYRLLVDALVDNVLKSTPYKILLVPHVFGSEHEERICSSILESVSTRYPGRVFMLGQPLSERELKWLIGQTQFFIGSRMHACIAALSQFVPTVGLAYSDKFLGVFQSAGIGDAVIDLRRTEIPEVVALTLAACRNREQLSVRLRSHIPVIQGQVVETFDRLLHGRQLTN